MGSTKLKCAFQLSSTKLERRFSIGGLLSSSALFECFLSLGLLSSSALFDVERSNYLRDGNKFPPSLSLEGGSSVGGMDDLLWETNLPNKSSACFIALRLQLCSTTMC